MAQVNLLMKVLTGIYSKDCGTIEYLGREVSFKDPETFARSRHQYYSQELNLVGNLTIAENIFLGREFTLLGRLTGTKCMQTRSVAYSLAFSHSSHQSYVPELSIGEQQIIAEIAKTLSAESKVIIMDEPTDALTDESKRVI